MVQVVAEAAQAAGLPPERVRQLELAVEEAVVNVCRYAYGGGGGNLVVRVTHAGGALAVEVEDRGAAFDPLAQPLPDTAVPIERRPIGGLGILLIQRMVDEVRYRRAGDRNVLTLVVRLSG